MSAQTNLAAVVVHHRSYEAVGRTVARLIDEGVQAANIVVVDNSEEFARRTELVSTLPNGVSLQFVANRGYGDAVNQGLDHLLERIEEPAPTYIVVATHEALVQAGSLGTLVSALDDAPQAAAVGPTLMTGSTSSPVTWSRGGQFSGVLHQPLHHGHLDRHASNAGGDPHTRDWLDGAFVVYRVAAIAGVRISRHYFMYMEEVDLHQRLRRSGWTILSVPDAVAWQSSNGVPPYWFARNIRLLLTRTDSPWRGAVGSRALILRRALGMLKRGTWSAGGNDLIKGAAGKLPETATTVVAVNPLGQALSHYATGLSEVLSRAGLSVRLLQTEEPSASGKGRAAWLMSYVALLAAAALRTRINRSITTVVLWPVLGYLDLILIRLVVGPRSALVIHDPVPLVGALGYGRVARMLGTWAGKRVRIIVHSKAAEDDLDVRLDKSRVSVLPHPIVEAVPPDRDGEARPVTIRVLGQYKPDRDLAALEEVSSSFPSGAVLEIWGRGWPEVAGWEVHQGFVAENELDQLIGTSSVVLIPYSRFYQSGIAFRCVELGTPFVGPSSSSLSDITGLGSPLLVDQAGGWSSAIEAAVVLSESEMSRMRSRWSRSCVKSWWNWVEQ